MSQFSNLFVEKYIKFDEKSINNELIPISIPSSKFGILALTCANAVPIHTPLDFVFMIDRSGSMSDKCSDGRSKMQHITHTLKNMIIYFSENPNINVHVTIYAFDFEVTYVLNRTIITNANIQEIIEKIEKIHPRGSTNMQLSLETMNTYSHKLLLELPDNIICNIFMTDGEATSGNVNSNFLSELVVTSASVTNSFIGFGVDHDTVLLNTLCCRGHNSSYYFIDKIENAGLVYGEILHSIIYKLLINVQITIENGLIYDFKNNIWVKHLFIGEFVSEANKIYHIASSNPENCIIHVSANKLVDLENVDITIYPNKQIYEYTELTKYIYRQRTLQHLYIVNEFLKRKTQKLNSMGTTLTLFTFVDEKMDEADINEEKELRKILREFIQEMKNYMSEKNLMDDKLMKNLCDDIYICYRTFNTRYGSMYVCARQASQGSQRGYSANNTPVDITDNTMPNAPKLKRNRDIDNDTRLYFDNVPILDPFDMEDNFIEHELSSFDDIPYLTPSSAKIMRAISSPKKDDLEESFYISPTSSCCSSLEITP